ncbi:MAG TPA: 50S ribosomal protein L21 [Ktedonobacterales bacterium]|nr:50S ribosomal protein L21 [Ktedonobacterales bacterium]
MYAVIETGGKQYRVSPGQTVEVELLPAEPGATVTLDRVLLVSAEDGATVGQPLVPGGAVVATVIGEGRGKKVIVFKYKSKKRYRRTTGHRQDYTYLTVTDIQAKGESLVQDDERKRYERQAARAVNRYERKLLAAFDALISSIIAETGVSADDIDVVDVEGEEPEAEAPKANAKAAPKAEAARAETPKASEKSAAKKTEQTDSTATKDAKTDTKADTKANTKTDTETDTK